MNRKEAPMQVRPVTTLLRDAWDDATEDDVVCPQEITTITVLIAQADDGNRLAVAAMRGGTNIRRVRRVRDEFEELHGPIDFEAYTKKRRHCGNSDDAA